MRSRAQYCAQLAHDKQMPRVVAAKVHDARLQVARLNDGRLKVDLYLPESQSQSF
jgi:hypothetical protein